MADIREIRRLYDIRDVLDQAGVHVGRRRTMLCPLPIHSHENYTPSFSIFVGSDGIERFKCHGACNAYGDVIDLAGYLWVPGYDSQRPDHLHQAINMLEKSIGITIPTSEKPVLAQLTLDPTQWKQYLPIQDSGLAYMRSRAIRKVTVEKFHVGQDGNVLTIPTFENGRLKAIKRRPLYPGRLRFWCEEGSRSSLFNFDAVAYQIAHVFYVKAEIPVMLMDQAGLLACAPVMGEGSFQPSWRPALALASVTVIGDNDKAGREAALQRGTDLEAQIRFPPSQYKDIDDWMLAEPVNSMLALARWRDATNLNR